MKPTMEVRSVVNFSELVGKTFCQVTQSTEGVCFEVNDSEKYRLRHEEHCCEYVYLEDVCGDLRHLEGSPILEAREDSLLSPSGSPSSTWTFYNITTAKGHVTLRFYGESNGCYSETAELWHHTQTTA